MKLFFTLGFLVSHFTLFGQYTYTFRIKDTQNSPMPNVLVTAENQAAKIVLKERTNSEGKAIFTLTVPGTYIFSYLELKEVAKAEVEKGMRGTFSRSVTYDPKGYFAEKPKADRTGVVFKTIPAMQNRGLNNQAKVTIVLKKIDRTTVPDIDITLVSMKDKTKYTSKSNSIGQTVFYLPIDQTYEIDVENLVAYQTLKVANFANMEMTEVVFFEKTKTPEKVKGDTVFQNAVTNTTGTSTHDLFTFQLKDLEGAPLSNESVFLQSTTSKRVYAGKTNEKGTCVLLIEKGGNYAVNVKYESNLLLVEAPVSSGFHSSGATRRYRGSLEIEKMMAEQKAQMERAQEAMRLDALRPKPGDKDYLITYRSTPIQPLKRPSDLSYLTKTPEGLKIDFNGNAGTVGTPTIIDGFLYSREGLYSANYYCTHATTGTFVWGVALGESGISPAVYHKGVLLINTASCTLYAIDAKTGELLWSKWLAGYVYSTPSADESDVFVVYKHGGTPVLVSFDLISGKLNWMQRVDDETIACPVVADNEVHVASQSGSYSVFNKKTGSKIKTLTTYKMVSSPTVTSDKIYITARIENEEQVIVLDRKSFSLSKKYPVKMVSTKISGKRDVDETDQMNYNGSHPVVYQNKYLIVTDATHLYAFDVQSEKLLWQQDVLTNADQLPIIANNMVIITTTAGDVKSFDVESGTSKIIKKSTGNCEGQPIASNGWLYLATGGFLTVVKSIQNFEWNQWNKDAGHNTEWK